MTRNPLINSLAALGYIVLVCLAMNFVTQKAGPPAPFLAMLAFISLFTLSAAVMTYLFAYQPVQLYFAGHKKAAITLFLHTTALFGLFTLILFAGVYFGLFRTKN
jgi:hypothetical protein